MRRYKGRHGKKHSESSPRYRLISPPNDRHETAYLGDDPYESYNWQTIEPPASSRVVRSAGFDAGAAARLNDVPGSYYGDPVVGPPSYAPSAPGNYYEDRAIGHPSYAPSAPGNYYEARAIGHPSYAPSAPGNYYEDRAIGHPSYASRQPWSHEGYQASGPRTYDQIYGHGSYGQTSGHGIHARDFGYLNNGEDYGHGSHGHHGQHHGGPHGRDGYDGTSHRHGKRPAYDTSASQHPRHHHSGRSGGHRAHAYDEQLLHDQMLAMSLQHKDEYSLAVVLEEPADQYSGDPRSGPYGYEYGEQSSSSFVPPGHGRRHRGHGDISDPHLGHYKTISPKTRDHHGRGSKSSPRYEACGVCFDEYPVTNLYKLCPRSKCPLYCGGCTKGNFPTVSDAS